MLQTKFEGKIKTHILYSIPVFFENYAVYEIIWKTLVDLEGPQTTIWCKHIACWIPMTTNTQSLYVKLITSPPQHWFQERTSMLRHTYIASLVNYRE
jgi:hypothetical protein